MPINRNPCLFKNRTHTASGAPQQLDEPTGRCAHPHATTAFPPMKEKSELETVALRLYLPAGEALHPSVYPRASRAKP